MIVTKDTPRRHVVSCANTEVTLFRRTETGYAKGITIPAYAEFGRSGIVRKYGVGTDYKGLIIIDGMQKYVDEGEGGEYFELHTGDKLVPKKTSLSVSELLASKERLYTVMDVTTYTMYGALLTVEVACG